MLFPPFVYKLIHKKVRLARRKPRAHAHLKVLWLRPQMLLLTCHLRLAVCGRSLTLLAL